ncbi:hypothetical protein BDR03DRAFT_985635 [Suillus americanus]|nr:hypothetical protein BDR03DRAFT_985635 [Suillus americanus]
MSMHDSHIMQDSGSALKCVKAESVNPLTTVEDNPRTVKPKPTLEDNPTSSASSDASLPPVVTPIPPPSPKAEKENQPPTHACIVLTNSLEAGELSSPLPVHIIAVLSLLPAGCLLIAYACSSPSPVHIIPVLLLSPAGIRRGKPAGIQSATHTHTPRLPVPVHPRVPKGMGLNEGLTWVEGIKGTPVPTIQIVHLFVLTIDIRKAHDRLNVLVLDQT